eukprot:CAMPEP_0115384128 /NCGR_PEP_ID=MMETSP0271-20121206/6947_1 /TAXON_ID=71861 /ORGANISM="Scrippsiella trochoidea, Strain CCMP3099" /LENGTH=476 /DNA_ID=CAMNT_0002807471 /DNA_START=126 /DNA_END=1553 /DNA_ORIENTATION=+
MLQSMLAVATCIRYWFGLLTCWSWETVAVASMSWCFFSTPLMSAWHVASIYGEDPAEVWLHDLDGAQMNDVVIKIVVVSAVCLYIPVRTCVLWIVPTLASISHICASAYIQPHQSSLHLQAQCFMFFVFIFSVHGAMRNEKHVRERWLAIKRADQQESVAGAFRTVDCIIGPDTRLDAFFGKCVSGKKLSELIVVDDQARFLDTLLAATQSNEIQSVPVTLDLAFATIQVQLIVVDTQTQASHYLVGLHSVEHKPKLLAESPEHTMAAEGDTSQQSISLDDTQTQVQSLATTTLTGKVFADISRLNASADSGLQRQLERVAFIGQSEHWLVGTEDVQLLPDVVLGSGGFGVVVGAQLRGQAVAAKLPRQSAQLNSLKFVSTIANELRIHRQIRHPNIVPFLAACVDPDRSELALIFELSEGVRLSKFLCTEVDALSRLKMLLKRFGLLAQLEPRSRPLRPQARKCAGRAAAQRDTR